MSEIAKALLAAQQEMPDLVRDSTLQTPRFTSTFISLGSLLSQVLPVLQRHGLLLTQAPSNVAGLPALTTRIEHAESGEFLQDTMLLMSSESNPQQQGSAITYARRYALMSMLGLTADEDDEGNAAMPPERQGTVHRQAQRPQSNRQRTPVGNGAPPV